MGDSVRLQIADAVMTALGQASVTLHTGTPQEATYTKPASLTVDRFRTRPVQESALPHQLVAILQDPDPGPDATGLLRRKLMVGVESSVKVTGGVPGDDAVDPLLNWAVHALMADESLGGVAHDGGIQERGTSWSPHETDVTIMQAQQVFEISYQTRRNDPELAT